MIQESQNGKSQGSNSAVESGVHFTEADFRAIAKELRTECTLGLKNQLISAAANYLSLKDYWANRESTAELRTHLTTIGKQAKKLIESLESLSPLGHLVFKQELPDFERTIGEIHKLQEAAEYELQYLKFGRGGPMENAPFIAQLPFLGVLYHQYTGKQPGMSTDPVAGYFRGPFFRFVTAWLKAVEPDLVASEKGKHQIGKLIRNHLEKAKIFLKQ
jgi:hypothetical protein